MIMYLADPVTALAIGTGIAGLAGAGATVAGMANKPQAPAAPTTPPAPTPIQQPTGTQTSNVPQQTPSFLSAAAAPPASTAQKTLLGQ